VNGWETYLLEKAMFSSLGFEKCRVVPCFLGKNSKTGGGGGYGVVVSWFQRDVLYLDQFLTLSVIARIN